MQEISAAVALQPGPRSLKLGQGHRGPALVAQHAFEHGVAAVVEPLPARDLQISFLSYNFVAGLFSASDRPRGQGEG